MMSQSILDALADVEKASQEQAAASQAVAQEVAVKMSEIDGKVNQKMAEMDAKITQATDDVYKEVKKTVALALYVDAENGSPDNTGFAGSPLDSVTAAIKKVLPGTHATIYLDGTQRYVLNESVYLQGQKITFKPVGTDGVNFGTFTHAAYKAADAIRTYSLMLGEGAEVNFISINVDTARWSEWVSHGSTLDYEVALFRGHGSSSFGDGKVNFVNSKVMLNNSPLIHQHSAGAVGWMGKMTFVSSKVSKRDLSSELVQSGYQYLVEQYGSTPLMWEFDFTGSSVLGATLPELISPDVVTTNVRTTVPLTA